MDQIDKLIEELRNNPEVKRTSFSNKLLSNGGDMCSRHGYGGVRLYLLGQDTPEASVLLKVLEKMEEKNIPLEIGTLIFKKLNALKFVREI